MSGQTSETQDIHVSQIDEYFASGFLNNSKGPLSFSITQTGDQGYIRVTPVQQQISLEGEGVDFELSSCESLSLDDTDVSDYIKKPIYTSSALELFDFLLTHFESFYCTVEFSGNAWKILVTQGVSKTD